MRMFAYLLLSIFLSSFSCTQQKVPAETDTKVQTKATTTYSFPYAINSPDKRQEMPERLKEISGLAIAESGALYAIQDENGSIFHIHGEDIDEIPFRKDGDYEGIAIVEDVTYVTKSSGTVYKITNLGKDSQTREDFNDFLSDEDDVEGLCHHAASNSLLLICKSSGEEETGKRAIYQFDLETNQLKEKPFMELSLDIIINKIKTYAETDELFQKLIEKKGDELTFAPSAIAIHPMTGNYYITSSKGKMLMVINEKMDILHIAKLDKTVHAQPEGLVFDTQGNLFVSNEGKEGAGMIYQFIYK